MGVSDRAVLSTTAVPRVGAVTIVTLDASNPSKAIVSLANTGTSTDSPSFTTAVSGVVTGGWLTGVMVILTIPGSDTLLFESVIV